MRQNVILTNKQEARQTIGRYKAVTEKKPSPLQNRLLIVAVCLGARRLLIVRAPLFDHDFLAATPPVK